MWALILTVVIHGSNKGGASVAHVPGFTSQQACLETAKTWMAEMRRLDNEATVTVRYSAICAKT